MLVGNWVFYFSFLHLCWGVVFVVSWPHLNIPEFEYGVAPHLSDVCVLDCCFSYELGTPHLSNDRALAVYFDFLWSPHTLGPEAGGVFRFS